LEQQAKDILLHRSHPNWHGANRMLHWIGCARGAIARNDAEAAAFYTYALMLTAQRTAQSYMLKGIIPDVLANRKIRRGFDEYYIELTTRKAGYPKLLREVEAEMAKDAKNQVKPACRTVAERHDINAENLRQAFYRRLKR
jgi:hypothetical protein